MTVNEAKVIIRRELRAREAGQPGNFEAMVEAVKFLFGDNLPPK